MLRRAVGRLVDEDAVDGRSLSEPEAGVHDVSGCHRLTFLRSRVEVDHGFAGRHTDPHAEPESSLFVQLGDRIPNRERRPDATLGIVLVGDWSTEERHHGIADELLHAAPEALEFGAHALVERNEHGAHVFGIATVRSLGRGDEICEEHRYDLPLFAGAGNVAAWGTTGGAEACAFWKLRSTGPADVHHGQDRTLHHAAKATRRWVRAPRFLMP